MINMVRFLTMSKSYYDGGIMGQNRPWISITVKQ